MCLWVQFYLFTILSCLSFIVSTQSNTKLKPNLCLNPHIDSVAWIKEKKTFFFTSGGYYYFWNHEDMSVPFNPNTGLALPNGFSTGEAAVWINMRSNCAGRRRAWSYNIQFENKIVVSEKTWRGIRLISYDIDSHIWSQSIAFIDDRILGVSAFDYVNKPLNGIFTYGIYEIYFLQGDKYRAINYSNVCDEPMRDAKRIPGENSVSSDLHIDGNLIDSITWVEIEQTLYVFSGHKFYRITLDIERSGNGRLNTKDEVKEKSIRQDFFNFKADCSNVPTDDGPHQAFASVVASENKTIERSRHKLIIIGGSIVLSGLFVTAVMAVLACGIKKSVELDSVYSPSSSPQDHDSN